MMAATQFISAPPLAERLPQPRGRLRFNVDVGARSWLKVGGRAEALFQPADEADLAAFLAETPSDVPVIAIGAGSNVLIRDGGLPGVVIRLGGPLAGISVDGLTITAGGGALDLAVALTAQDAGIGGLAFLSGVPGTIGGAIRMNAGAFGGETSDCLRSARAVGRDGRIHSVDAAELGFSYRRCGAPADWVFTQAVFAGASTPKNEIAARIAEIKSERAAAQPTGGRTGGSTFMNPPGEKAWRLIDQAGCRGLRIGGAQMSEKHCNFLTTDGGSAADVEALGEEVRRRVRERSGIDLQWEIKRIGLPADDPGALS